MKTMVWKIFKVDSDFTPVLKYIYLKFSENWSNIEDLYKEHTHWEQLI